MVNKCGRQWRDTCAEQAENWTREINRQEKYIDIGIDI